MSQNRNINADYFRRYQENDAEFQAQRDQYGQAIPSRSFILELLAFNQSLDFDGVIKSFNLRKVWEQEAMENRLNAMIRAGQISKRKNETLTIVEAGKETVGIITAHAEGYGYLDADDGGDSLYIPPHEMQYFMHGDQVAAVQAGVDHRGRGKAKITRLIKHGVTQFIGRVFREGPELSIVPENRRITHHFEIDAGELKGAHHLDIVRAEVTLYPDKNQKATAKILETYGDETTVEIEIEQALLEHNIPYIFSEAVEAEVKNLPNEVSDAEIKGRKDYRDLPLVTIDGITARDFDDAVYCESMGSGYRLYVAIADVSHYVHDNTAIGEEANLRGTSVYFPQRVIPMLPRELSNGICSLNPDVNRLCMVAELDIDKEGNITDYSFREGVMRSHARLTYELVFDIVDGDELLRKSYETLTPHLDRLYALYKILRKKRESRGAIDFETTETLFIYNDEGTIDKIVPDERNDAHKIIEECMISANIAAAEFLEKNKIPTLYRVHLPPDDEKLNRLRAFLHEFGLGLSGGDEPTPADFAKTLEEAKGNDAFEMIQMVMLRSLTQAVYQPENKGHFGLSLTHYAHFTSPIRRYPDLVVHRAIKHLLYQKPKDQFYSEKEMVHLGEHSSMAERRADEAVRDVYDWLKAYYMQDFIGDQFEGHITGVTNFGIFVALNDIYIEGLIHISNISGDFYLFDAERHRLIGERTKQQYRLNDKVTIKVIEANPATKRIDFELISPVVADSGRKRGNHSKSNSSNNNRRGGNQSKNSHDKKPNDNAPKKRPTRGRRGRRKKK